MMSWISVAISRYFSDIGISSDKQTYYTISLPFNMKPQPKCIDDVQLFNHTSHILVNMPISNDLNYVVEQYKRLIDRNISISYLRFVVFVLSIIGSLPDFLIRLWIKSNSLGLDLVISNTPGAETPMYFCDQEVYDIGGIGSNIGGAGITILISSYWSKVKLQILTDSGISFEPKEFIKYVEEVLDEQVLINWK